MEDASSIILNLIPVIFAFICYVVFFIFVNENYPTGAPNTQWGVITKKVFQLWISPVIAILFTFLAIMYFIQYPNVSMYMALAMSCLFLGLSVASLSFALISR